MLQLLELLAETEVRIGRHQAIMLRKVLYQYGPILFDDAVRQGHIVIGARVLRGLAAIVATSLVEQHRKQQHHDYRQRHGDGHNHRRVALICKGQDSGRE